MTSTSNTIRAVRYDRYGPPEVLGEVELPRPAPGPGEVLVEVHGAGVGGGEPAIRQGRLRRVLRQHRLPQGVGVDFAGRIAGIGAGVDDVAPGDAVWGLMEHLAFGSTAELVVVPAARITSAPRGTDLVTAAALPSVGTTAIAALVHHARLQGGERLLVRGAGGGVGTVAVQLGRVLGAHVTAITGNRSLDLVRELGAHIAVDHRTTTAADIDHVDVVLDLVGTELAAYRRRLTPRGRIIALAIDPARPVRAGLAIGWNSLLRRGRFLAFSNDPAPEHIAELTRYVEDGRIRPVVDTVVPFVAVAEAHRRLEAGGVRGRIVVDVRGTSANERS